jgi:hypothetical protein
LNPPEGEAEEGISQEEADDLHKEAGLSKVVV